ncbi:DUF1877 family protein [Actinacidiphila soli]|uniref:DUF1877 family protein n=1 Tax=Actinacidiphila soli TaxID=2487275 RepID=UPI002AFE560B|nr:DUF1877 family protein [Actinacidiphila soli]
MSAARSAVTACRLSTPGLPAPSLRTPPRSSVPPRPSAAHRQRSRREPRHRKPSPTNSSSPTPSPSASSTKLTVGRDHRQRAARSTITSYENLVRADDRTDPTRAEVYPLIWHTSESLDYVRGHFESLRPFFAAAARDGDAMLIWLD